MSGIDRGFATLLLGACLVAPGPAQQTDQAKELIARRDRKLQAPFLKAAPWHTGFAEAKAAAGPQDRSILIYFTRSYAPSKACEAVENGVLVTPEFVALAEQQKLVLFCHVTSKVPSDPDQGLLQSMGGESFPFVVVTDGAGRRIASLGRIASVADIEGLLAGPVAGFRALQARAAQGDKAAKARYFLTRLQLGHLAPKEIEAELATAEYLTVEQQKQIRRSLATLEVMEILASLDAQDPRSRQAVALRMLAMMRAGRIPSDRVAFPFWQVLLGHADQTEDVDLFETSLRNIKKLPGGRLDERWLRKMEIRLRALRFMKQRKDGGK